MEEEAGTRYNHPEAGSMDETGPSSTGLTPLQPSASGLTTLTPLQQLPHHPTHQNGFHHNNTAVVNIKQEYDSWQDGESEEAQLFRKISVKREYYPLPQQQEGSNLELHTSPYFTHLDMESHLDIGRLRTHTPPWLIAPALAHVPIPSPSMEKGEIPKQNKRGRKPKIKVEKDGSKPAQSSREKHKRSAPEVGADGQPLPSPSKQRKKLDRFNGIPEEEVLKKKLPDHLAQNLDIVIIGINPGLAAAHRGHYYAGPGNHFWKCMYLSGLIPEPFTTDDDFRLLEYGIGFTNIVERTTRGSADLTRTEIKQGAQILIEKLRMYKPLIAVFNGKGIYEIYSGKKQFCFGRQPEKIDGTNTHIWVMPSSSARCAQLPRALDKVPFYSALRKFRDFLKGYLHQLDEAEVVFTNVKLTNVRAIPKVEPKVEPSDTTITTQACSPTKGKKSPKKKR